MSSTLFLFLFILFQSHQLTIADDEHKSGIVHEHQHESSTLLIHFTLDHFRGPLWKMSNLVYISNDDNDSNYQQRRQPHFRHWPIRNRIGIMLIIILKLSSLLFIFNTLT